jgi:PTH1 family peptidyl-tRNA hydrolase
MVATRRRLVVGLGNPGEAYRRTRHNIGFMAVDHIADEFSISLAKKKFDLIYGQGTIEGIPVVLAKPQSYMNLSGPPTRRIADYFRISSRDILVIHDDIDLAFERIKIKAKGGDGGHNGVRSVMDAFGGNEFTRLRIGVGRGRDDAPGERETVVGHVLGRFSPEEDRRLSQVLATALDAVVTILREGVVKGMNRFNGK